METVDQRRARLDKTEYLRANLEPVKISDGSGAYFPRRYLLDFFEYLKTHSDKYNIITYDDIPIQDTKDQEANYIGEFKNWVQTVAKTDEGKAKAHVLIQYDIDSRPERANALLASPHHDDIPANVMLFRDRIDRKRFKKTGELRFTEYDFDMELLKKRMTENYVMGYHTNAYEKSEHNMDRALEIFNDDMTYFHDNFGVKYFSAHGGVPGPNGLNNNSLPFDERWVERSTWVHNGRTLRFQGYFSDGGHNSEARDPQKRDLRDFVAGMEPGKRYRMLLHPQYYADNNTRSERFTGTPWYDEMIDSHKKSPSKSLWNDINPNPAFAGLV